MLNETQITELNKIAKQMVAKPKGILAADESFPSIEKRFQKIDLSSTEESRRAYREMLLTAQGMHEYISGVILFDETLRQSTAEGVKFVDVLNQESVLPGIKVDLGTYSDPNSENEKLTKGLEGLPERLKEYVSLGAKFCKWRAVITIGDGLPTDGNIRQNAKDLAAYALACQEAGLVPMVEPEVLMDWSNDQSVCESVSERVLTAVFEELKNAGVAIEGMILKTNMVVPGKESGQKATPEQVAEATVRVFKKVLPENLPGQAHLSGGQSEQEATANLNAINKLGKMPWNITFSYGRALQDGALKAWAGKPENVEAAQVIFSKRAKLNSLATLGEYSEDLEA